MEGSDAQARAAAALRDHYPDLADIKPQFASELVADHPGVDAALEITAAKRWEDDNPTRPRKDKAAFLRRWIRRAAQDRVEQWRAPGEAPTLRPDRGIECGKDEIGEAIRRHVVEYAAFTPIAAEVEAIAQLGLPISEIETRLAANETRLRQNPTQSSPIDLVLNVLKEELREPIAAA